MRFLPPVLASCLLAALSAQSPITPERGWSIVRSDLVVDVEPAEQKLEVSGTLTLVLDQSDSSPGPSLWINARNPLMKWRTASCEGAEIELGHRHPNRPARRLAQVNFPEPKSRGDEIAIRFACDFVGAGRQLVLEDNIAIASWVEAWYPVPEAMPGTSLSGATRAKGTTKFVLPEGWSAVTNGSRTSRKNVAGRTVEVWSTDRALARSFAVAKFQRLVHETDSFSASLYLLSDRAKDPKAHVEALGNAIEAMAKRLQPYPFQNFSIAEVPSDVGAFGASSEQGFILVKPFFLAVPGGNLPLFAHEAAHAWWGNTVGTTGPGAILLSESLSQYGAVIAIEAMEGKAAATAFLRFSRHSYIPNQSARGYFYILRNGDDVPLATLTSRVEVGHALANSKGHWVYHMLRRRVGDEVFFATLRQLIAEHDGRAMALDVMRRSFQKAAPHAGLERFFTQWLDQAGAPVLEAKTLGGDAGTTLQIRQVQDGNPYALDLTVELLRSDGERQRLTVRTGKSKTEVFPLDLPAHTTVQSVVLDPDHDLLIWHPDYGAAPTADVDDDPAVAASERSRYVGDYAVQGRAFLVRIVERDERLRMVIGDQPEQNLIPSGVHAFRTDSGQIRFRVIDGKADAFELRTDDGQVMRARRF